MSEAYLFLRNVEHKIQMVREAHTYFMPKAEDEEHALARRLNYGIESQGKEREYFWDAYHHFTSQVRHSFEQLFFGAQRGIETESSGMAGKLWNDLNHEELALEEGEKLGFADSERACRSLLEIREGTPYSPASPRRHKVMRALGPALMAEVLRFGSPDQTLFHLAEFGHRVSGRTGFLSLLAETPKTMRLLIRLFANSRFLTELFLKRPELLDNLIRVDLSRLRKTQGEMVSELQSNLEQAQDLEAKLNALRRYRTEEFIRIGLHDIGEELELEEVISQLSDLADACLQGTVTLAYEEVDKGLGPITGGQFGIMAMGELGGREINYHSDLDIIFIYATLGSLIRKQTPVMPMSTLCGWGKRSSPFIPRRWKKESSARSICSSAHRAKAGPLVTSLEALRNYHETSADLWERQALIKSRFAVGNEDLGRAAETVAQATAYGRGLEEKGVGEIHHLRIRMEKELAGESQSRFNLKKGRGGMADIEFTTQMLQLLHERRHPSLRKTGTLEALRELRDIDIVPDDDYLLLSEGYRILRRLDHRLRLEQDQSLDILERESTKLQGIAHAMGYKADDEGQLLLKDYEQRREQICSCYNRYFSVVDKAEQIELTSDQN